MVVDNVDDEDVVFEKKATGKRLLSCIPKSEMNPCSSQLGTSGLP
jgi:hypothetical protein